MRLQPTLFAGSTNLNHCGSGWVILAYNQHTHEMHNYWAWDHMHNAAAAKYVDVFMQNVNWEEVNRRAEAAMKS
jgi:Fe-Mn family superoxide dismutase